MDDVDTDWIVQMYRSVLGFAQFARTARRASEGESALKASRDFRCEICDLWRSSTGPRDRFSRIQAKRLPPGLALLDVTALGGFR